MPPIDDATRPRVAGSIELEPRQRAAGDHLRMVHDHFRHQLETLARAVAARLAEEHLVVHAHLERVDDLAVAVRTDPGRVSELVAAVADLRADLESHFTYEETEMAEPLGLLGLGP